MAATDDLRPASGTTPRRSGTERWDEAYPKALRDREGEFLDIRKRAIDKDAPPRDPSRVVGVAVSGGGIRSATFALGFFQAIASVGGLRWIDYLSTVSGGSYFGGFLGALFTPRTGSPTTVDEVERILSDPVSRPNRWLRENGRYLAPAGGGDVLAAAASYVRSFVTIHIVLGILVVGLLLGAFALRGFEAPSWERELAAWAVHGVWPSPWLAVPVAVLVLVAVPLGWAFWLMPGQSIGRAVLLPWLAIPATIVSAWFRLWSLPARLGFPPIRVPEGLLPWASEARAMLIALPALALVFALLALTQGDWSSTQVGAVRRLARGRLSTWLSWALTTFGVVLVFALIDTAGQSLYAYLRHDNGKPWSLWTIVPVIMASGLPAVAQSVFARLSSRDGSRPGIPIALLANLAAVLIIGTHLTLLATLSHGIAWSFAVPANDPAVAMFGGSGGEAAVPLRVATAGYGVLIAFGISVLLGRSWSFLNLSTFQALYAGRLTRAYLGASNPARMAEGGSNSRLSDPVPGDDIARVEYRPFASGGPLHLVNVTINETVTGESQTEYRDRKGIGLAIGPAGMSAGIRHHALWNDEAGASAPGFLGRTRAWFKRKTVTFREARAAITPIRQPDRFEMFDGFSGPPRVEQLPMGAWVGISGAAFGTGLGYRTSIALSLLAGFFNIRLGYWWDSYIRPSARGGATPSGGIIDVGRWITRAFPVQLYLLDEWLARFRGPSRRLWNLSDGGHFENTAGYELVRRRLPFIILLDDGEDPEWRFEDLGNFVRKVRLDFGAQVEFVEPERLPEVWDWARAFLGKDAAAVIVDLKRLRPTQDGPLDFKTSPGYATLARITYDGSADVSWLLVVKPTLAGDEPLDVLQYRREHEAFPQEPTAEQFFGEAQWESYRRLGERIGRRLFA